MYVHQGNSTRGMLQARYVCTNICIQCESVREREREGERERESARAHTHTHTHTREREMHASASLLALLVLNDLLGAHLLNWRDTMILV